MPPADLPSRQRQALCSLIETWAHAHRAEPFGLAQILVETRDLAGKIGRTLLEGHQILEPLGFDMLALEIDVAETVTLTAVQSQ